MWAQAAGVTSTLWRSGWPTGSSRTPSGICLEEVPTGQADGEEPCQRHPTGFGEPEEARCGIHIHR